MLRLNQKRQEDRTGIRKQTLHCHILERKGGRNIEYTALFAWLSAVSHRRSYKVLYGSDESFEVMNPAPVSYDEGIVAISAFTIQGDLKVYEQFLQSVRPEVVHIHTLMGLHRNLLAAAKKMGIRTVFTAHDFFPICPKVTLFRDGMICPDADTCASCPGCNMTALSLRKIQVLQSPAYRILKDSPIVKKLRKGHRDEYLSGQAAVGGKPIRTAEDYRKLREYYRSLLDLMDMIHYNSSVTRAVYEQYMGGRKSILIPITHGDIQDHRKKKKSGRPIRFTYLSAQSAAKGYFVLKSVLDELWKERQDFELNVFFKPTEDAPYIRQHERYDYAQLERIMDHTDVLGHRERSRRSERCDSGGSGGSGFFEGRTSGGAEKSFCCTA